MKRLGAMILFWGMIAVFPYWAYVIVNGRFTDLQSGYAFTFTLIFLPLALIKLGEYIWR